MTERFRGQEISRQESFEIETIEHVWKGLPEELVHILGAIGASNFHQSVPAYTNIVRQELRVEVDEKNVLFMIAMLRHGERVFGRRLVLEITTEGGTNLPALGGETKVDEIVVDRSSAYQLAPSVWNNFRDELPELNLIYARKHDFTIYGDPTVDLMEDMPVNQMAPRVLVPEGETLESLIEKLAKGG